MQANTYTMICYRNCIATSKNNDFKLHHLSDGQHIDMIVNLTQTHYLCSGVSLYDAFGAEQT